MIFAQVGDVFFFVRQQIVGEAGIELGQLLVDGGVTVLGLPLEGGAVAGKAVIDQFDQALLVGTQTVDLVAFINGADPGEQFIVLPDFGLEVAELRTISFWMSRNSGLDILLDQILQ